MNFIAVQPYVKVHRHVDGIEQYEIEHERNIYLYSDKIVTEHHQFQMEKVLDISFRSMAGEGGLLYIHTSGGLYSYIVKTSPQHFIQEYKRFRDQ